MNRTGRAISCVRRWFRRASPARVVGPVDARPQGTGARRSVLGVRQAPPRRARRPATTPGPLRPCPRTGEGLAVTARAEIELEWPRYLGLRERANDDCSGWPGSRRSSPSSSWPIAHTAATLTRTEPPSSAPHRRPTGHPPGSGPAPGPPLRTDSKRRTEAGGPGTGLLGSPGPSAGGTVRSHLDHDGRPAARTTSSIPGAGVLRRRHLQHQVSM